HHTNCGMELFTDEVMADLLTGSLKTATYGKEGWTNQDEARGSTEGRYVRWLTIKDQAESVAEDVRRIRSHPLVPRDLPIYGYIYDVTPGRLIEIPEATRAGKAA